MVLIRPCSRPSPLPLLARMTMGRENPKPKTSTSTNSSTLRNFHVLRSMFQREASSFAIGDSLPQFGCHKVSRVSETGHMRADTVSIASRLLCLPRLCDTRKPGSPIPENGTFQVDISILQTRCIGNEVNLDVFDASSLYDDSPTGLRTPPARVGVEHCGLQVSAPRAFR